MRALRPALLAFALLAAAPALASSPDAVRERIDALHGDVDGFDEAFVLLTEAMRFGDPVTVAALGAYPLVVEANGEVYDILEEGDLVDNFGSLVMDETQSLVAAQDYGALIVTSDGVGFADGALWMALVCEDQACGVARWAVVAIDN